jgi:Kef-type K+ transport system membrane component KefB
MDPMLALLIIIILAYAFGEAAKHFGIPRVVGQLFAGLILGIPFIRDVLLFGRNAELISFLADLGILLLFFFVGLQIKTTEFKKNVGESALIALFNTAIPFIAGFVIFKYLLGYKAITAIIVGMCLSVSSQSVSLAVLDELKLLKTKISQHIITAGAVDDLFELALISVVLTLIHASVGQASTARVIMDVSIFVAAIVAFRYIIVPVLMNMFAEQKSITHLFTGAIVITLVLALVTLYLGLGAIIGALFAGIIVREILLTGKKKKPWEEHNISKAIHIVSFGFLVPIFFAWVGMNTDITTIILEWKLVLLLFGIAIIGTVVGSVLGVRAHGGSWKEGYVVGWGLSAKGDVELVIASLALSQALISESVFSALIMTAMFTTLIAPIFFRHLVQKYHRYYGKKS